MQPDIATVRETGSLVRAVWPWVKRLLAFRKRLEEKIEIDLMPWSDAVRVDLASATHAINVCLKIYNFSFFSVKLEKVTGSITMKSQVYKQIVFNECIPAYSKVPRRKSTSVNCVFKLNDSQVRALREFNQCHDLQVGLTIDAHMSSWCGALRQSRPERDILVRPWYQPAEV